MEPAAAAEAVAGERFNEVRAQEQDLSTMGLVMAAFRAVVVAAGLVPAASNGSLLPGKEDRFTPGSAATAKRLGSDDACRCV
jgi:hypothetical protein